MSKIVSIRMRNSVVNMLNELELLLDIDKNVLIEYLIVQFYLSLKTSFIKMLESKENE